MAVAVSKGVTVHGLERGKIIWTDDFAASEDDKGAITVRKSFHCYLDEFFSVCPRKGSACNQPGWNSLLLTNLAVDGVKAGVSKVICTYSFLNPDNSFTFDGSQDTYESSVTTSEEPITTHKKYADVPEGELRAIVKAQNGQFVLDESNAPETYTLYPFGEGPDSTDAVELTDANAIELYSKFIAKGVDSYLAIHQTFRETAYRKIMPSDLFHKVGRIDNPPSKAPSLDSGSNWLYSGATVTRQSSYYIITREWIASGPGGFATEIYD